MSLSPFEIDIYQQMILDHNRSPHNFCEMKDASLKAEGYNPLCGDHLWIYVKFDVQGKIENVCFQGSGCAISKASASMMTLSLKGKSKEDAESIFNEFHHLIIGELEPEQTKVLGKLKIFAGICKYPSRVKCAGLAWHTLHNALVGNSDKVANTETGTL